MAPWTESFAGGRVEQENTFCAFHGSHFFQQSSSNSSGLPQNSSFFTVQQTQHTLICFVDRQQYYSVWFFYNTTTYLSERTSKLFCLSELAAKQPMRVAAHLTHTASAIYSFGDTSKRQRFLPAVNVNMVFQVLGGLFQVLGGQTAGQMTKFGTPNTWQTMFTAGKKNRSRFDVSPKLYIAEADGSGVVYARGNGPSNLRKINCIQKQFEGIIAKFDNSRLLSGSIGEDPRSGVSIRIRQVWFHRPLSFESFLYYIDLKQIN